MTAALNSQIFWPPVDELWPPDIFVHGPFFVRRHLEASKWWNGLGACRVSASSRPPGASGDTARPNYMGPSGNGLVGADERG
jgi:hypothetical protein